MRLSQSKSLRWFFAELLVIVLGISIAFQVEEWRQHRHDKVLEAKAFQEVLGDLDTMEHAVGEAIETYGFSSDHARKLVGLIQSGSPDESAYLEHIANMAVYLLGEAEDQFAYMGLLDEGRFADVEDTELTAGMRQLFTLVKPWIFSLNLRHIELYDELKEEIFRDVKRVPDEDFSSTGKSHNVIAVPIEEFPSSPEVVNGLLKYIDSATLMIEKLQLLQQEIVTLRQAIHANLES